MKNFTLPKSRFLYGCLDLVNYRPFSWGACCEFGVASDLIFSVDLNSVREMIAPDLWVTWASSYQYIPRYIEWNISILSLQSCHFGRKYRLKKIISRITFENSVDNIKSNLFILGPQGWLLHDNYRLDWFLLLKTLCLLSWAMYNTSITKGSSPKPSFLRRTRRNTF